MLNTSQDLLYIVGAFAILWLAIFLCWFLYYLVLVLRDVHHITRDLREKIEWWGELIKTIREKLVSSSATAALLMRSGLELINYYRKNYATDGRTDETEETTSTKKKAKQK